MDRLLKIVLGGALLLLAPLGAGPAAGQAQSAAAAPVPFAGIPGVERLYYDVSGTTVQAIRQSIDGHASRPRDPNDGLRVDALANWYMRWSWPAGPNGGCDLARTRLEFSARVTMPRLLDEARVPATGAGALAGLCRRARAARGRPYPLCLGASRRGAGRAAGKQLRQSE